LYKSKYSCHAQVIYIFLFISSHLTRSTVINKFAFTLGFKISLVLASMSFHFLNAFEKPETRAFTIIIIKPAPTQCHVASAA
jgi:hypothetical protein